MNESHILFKQTSKRINRCKQVQGLVFRSCNRLVYVSSTNSVCNKFSCSSYINLDNIEYVMRKDTKPVIMFTANWKIPIDY